MSPAGIWNQRSGLPQLRPSWFRGPVKRTQSSIQVDLQPRKAHWNFTGNLSHRELLPQWEPSPFKLCSGGWEQDGRGAKGEHWVRLPSIKMACKREAWAPGGHFDDYYLPSQADGSEIWFLLTSPTLRTPFGAVSRSISKSIPGFTSCDRVLSDRQTQMMSYVAQSALARFQSPLMWCPYTWHRRPAGLVP